MVDATARECFEPSGIRGPAVAGWAALAALLLLGAGGAATAVDGRVLLGLPHAAEVGLVGALLLAIHLVLRPRPRALAIAAGLGLAPLLLLVGVRLPGLSALAGRPLLALAAAAVVVAATGGPPVRERALFLPVIACVYALTAARVQAQVGPEGDEPHYLVVADSIWHDHDVEVGPDFAAGRYRAFHPGELEPHYRVRGREGRIYSLHALGLSLWILPAYVLGGYPAASYLMAATGVAAAAALRRLLEAWAPAPTAAGLAWLLALSPPLVHYSGLVFTEVPAAAGVALGLAVASARIERVPVALAAGTVLAFLPWLNVRYIALTAIILCLALWWRPRVPVAVAWVVPAVVSAGSIAAYHWALYGFWDPRQVYGRRPELSLGLVPGNLPGLLLDQEFGLLVYAPIFALAVPGLVRGLRDPGRRALAVAAIALVAAVTVTAASWPMWRGGFNPPARFLVPVVPALALGVAWALERGLTAGAVLLAGWSLWVGLAGAAEPRLVHRDRDGTAPFFRAFSGADEWTRLLPGYVLPETARDRGPLTAVWTAVLVVAAWPRRRPELTASGLCGGLVVLCGAAALASRLATASSEGRDAVRLLGRDAFAPPDPRPRATDAAAWPAATVGWTLYEPHRHPDGAVVGGRLDLPSGRYRLALRVHEMPGVAVAPSLLVRADGPAPAREVEMGRAEGALTSDFDLGDGGSAVTLAVRGGSPFELVGVELTRVQPLPRPPV